MSHERLEEVRHIRIRAIQHRSLPREEKCHCAYPGSNNQCGAGAFRIKTQLPTTD